jgi:glycosyltransferase involved in cell wall biosynthesis
MVGPVLEISGKEGLIHQLRAMRNVHFLGNKPAGDLPAYVQRFDVCLMCYEINNYTRYIYPLKLHEYLATGLPIVSSGIAAVHEFGSVVRVAATDSEWLAEVQAGLQPSAMAPEAIAARQAAARKHDWQTLVDQVGDILRATLVRRIASRG